METITVTISFRTVAVTEEIDDAPYLPLFAKRLIEVFEKMISIVARGAR
jgi:hypothetical protein